MPSAFFKLLSLALEGLALLIIIEVILSWATHFGARISPYHPLVRTLRKIVDPVLNPIRRALPPPWKTGGMDFAPMVACILLQVLAGIVYSLG
jgi:uncharacterized protein YggT (Ycf19 family)